MASKQARGTKRTCQNGDCGSRFYDLNRQPIVCPICGSVYQIASSPAALQTALAADKTAARKSKKPEFEPDEAAAEDTETVEAEEELAEAATDGEEPIAPAADETFLEEEEESGDVSNILGGSVAEGDEEV